LSPSPFLLEFFQQCDQSFPPPPPPTHPSLKFLVPRFFMEVIPQYSLPPFYTTHTIMKQNPAAPGFFLLRFHPPPFLVFCSEALRLLSGSPCALVLNRPETHHPNKKRTPRLCPEGAPPSLSLSPPHCHTLPPSSTSHAAHPSPLRRKQQFKTVLPVGPHCLGEKIDTIHITKVPDIPVVFFNYRD